MVIVHRDEDSHTPTWPDLLMPMDWFNVISRWACGCCYVRWAVELTDLRKIIAPFNVAEHDPIRTFTTGCLESPAGVILSHDLHIHHTRQSPKNWTLLMETLGLQNISDWSLGASRTLVMQCKSFVKCYFPFVVLYEEVKRFRFGVYQIWA